jgi:uncharacterized membrane protein YcaP (DUF421 family)
MYPIWHPHAFEALFHLPDVVSVGEKILRPILVYLFLIVLLRVFGKRELAQLNPFDLVVLLSLANTVQNAIIGDDTSLVGGMIGAFSLCAFNYVVVRFMFRHRRLDELFAGTPTGLIEAGKICRDGMAKEMLTEAELVTVAHRQGFASLDEISSCVLEPGGTFSIQAKKPRGPDRRHHEMLDQMKHLAAQIEELKHLIHQTKNA